MSQTKAQKAFYVLKDTMDFHDMLELMALLGDEVEKQSQDIMKETL